MQTPSPWRLAFTTAAVTAAVIGWDLSSLDMVAARWFGGPEGFPLQDQWFFVHVLHDAVRLLAWLAVLLLCLGVWFPAGWLKRLPFRRRLQLSVSTLAAALLVHFTKSLIHTSCPWNLADFGGIAQYVSHWSTLVRTDGGSGGCFPAGHASAGFAFVGGYFAFRQNAPVLARRWLAVALAVGLVVGLSQQMRGAHFMSHTLWSGWLCWCVAWAIDGLMDRLPLARVSADFGELA